MPLQTQGPLPPGVYWRRRAFVGLLAVALVFVLVSWLRGGSDAKDGAPAAEQAAGEVEASETITVPSSGATDAQGGSGGSYGPTADPRLLVEPDGDCTASDVRVRPRIDEAAAGDDVTVGLSLQTRTAEACNWRVDAKNVTVKISDASGEVWTSRECPKAVPEQDVVVRRAIATVVEMTWDARESDAGCPDTSDWVWPGDFTIATSSLGGEPAKLDFELTDPTPTTVTPKPDRTRSSDSTPTGGSSDTTEKPSTRATPRAGGDDSPSGPPRR